jgi:SHS2 domain-containing protein
MAARFTLLAHPSDVGIEARGATLAEAFTHVADGMMSLIADPSTIRGRVPREIILEGADVEHLLFLWLSEILYLYDGEQFVVRHATVTSVNATHLRAIVVGEPIDRSRHQFRADVKGITYHQLTVEQSGDEVALRVFVDI